MTGPLTTPPPRRGSGSPALASRAIAPTILAVGGGSFGVLYRVAGVCAVIGAIAILPVRRVR